MPSPIRYVRHKQYYRRYNAQYRARYPWYDCWKNARCRCENPKNKNFKNYSSKGIKFLLSKEDVIFMWERDQAQLMDRPSIDRRNPDGHYELQNCRFLEHSENSRRLTEPAGWTD